MSSGGNGQHPAAHPLDNPVRASLLGPHVLVASIRARGDTPFLHAVAANTGAIRLYESMGFRLRQTTVFRAVQTPAADRVSPAR